MLNPDDGDSDDDRREGRPNVGADAPEDLARVDADGFEEAASEAVPDEVDTEQLAPAQVELAVEVEKDGDADEVPDDLIQEDRLEQRALWQTGRESRVGRLDLEAPGQRRRDAEQFVVEPVAESAEGLSEQQSRRKGVSERPEADARHPASDVCTDGATDQRTEDGVAALPDVEGAQQVGAGVEVIAGVREHVVEPGADDTERHSPQDDVQNDSGLSTALGQSPRRHDRGDNDAGQDAQGVRVNAERSEVEEAPVGARNAENHGSR